MSVPHTETKAPERIYLQDDGDYEAARGEDLTWCADRINDGDTGYVRADLHAALQKQYEEAMEALQSGEASDGYHTHRELYEYRMLYNAHAALGWLAAGIPVVKSWRHSDGELCFGGGWFIVTAQLPTGQVSNHYRASHWDLFNVPEVTLPPEYDGHTPTDAAARLRDALLQRHKGGV